jgi:signal transduction histidine kinase/ActR/RegA family two-component response regulator
MSGAAASPGEQQPERSALREAAHAELTRSGLSLRFAPMLQRLYDAEQTPARVHELRQIVGIGVAINLILVLVINLLVVGHPGAVNLLWQMLFPPAAALLLSHFFFRPGVSVRLREAAVTVSCCCYSLAVLISVYISPTEMIIVDLTVVTLPVIIVLFFARQSFRASVVFTAFSAIGLLVLLLLRHDLPTTMRAYPMVFLLAAALPALLGVYRLEATARRVWLLRLLQSLQIDDLASENIELTAQAEATRRASEERLRQAQKMEAVGQLTGGIAHDFNNLLTTVIGSLELMRSRRTLDADNDALAANALASAERGARLTGQLLAFSRRQRLAPTALSLAAVVAGIRDLLERTLGANIDLRVAPADPLQWHVLADRNQLEMALLNLVINARDAIGERNGAVRIDFTHQDIGSGTVNGADAAALPPGDYVTISVWDNGAGMTPDVLARAFEPFFTTKQPGTGTGLGLSQAYGFASQSGGTLTIESAPGQGTRAAIILPRAVQAALAEARPKGPPQPGRGETILVAEDDALVRDTVAESLRDLGYTVLTACDGTDALAVLERAPGMDLLFTDVTMPGPLNGVALALAARMRWPRLKILFTSGYSDRDVLAQWPETLDVLQKPFNQGELAHRIAHCLHSADRGAEAAALT